MTIDWVCALTASFVMGCAATTPSVTRPNEAEAHASAEPLPAGTYFRDGFVEAAACEGCTEPRAALIAGTFTDDASASAAVRDSRSMGPGYPWVVDADELGLEDETARGMVVVVGLFETLEQARQASEGAYEVAPLATRAEALRRYSSRRSGDTTPIVQIDDAPEGRVPAYATGDLDAVFERSRNSSFDSLEHYQAVMAAHIAELEPACALPSGSVHSRADEGDQWRFHPLFVQARCEDGRDVWVRLDGTRVDTVVRTSAAGARLIQVVVVECDAAMFEEWRFGERGREPLGDARPTELAARPGCGGP